MYKHFVKRFLDILISGIALLLIGWFLILVAIFLHFANRGAGSFFTQDRPGKDGKIFRVIKFKTMTDERDGNGDLLPDAQRLTKIGKFVRSTSVDELPQLINILKGDMSLIGPRPLTPAYLFVFDDVQRRRMEMRPGISGWAQVHGRQNCKLSQKFEYDVWYVDNCSLWLDIKIVFMTLWNVLGRKNIGEGAESMDDIDDLGFKQKFEELRKEGKI